MSSHRGRARLLTLLLCTSTAALVWAAPPAAGAVTNLREDFEDGKPAGWTTLTTVGTASWGFGEWAPCHNLMSYTGRAAWQHPNCNGSGNVDTELRTPLLDLRGRPRMAVKFVTTVHWQNDEVYDVDVSGDGGSTWTNVWRRTHTSIFSAKPQWADISAIAGGQPDAMVRFRYHQGYGGEPWMIDDVAIDPPPNGADFDGDGYTDLAVGAPGLDDGTSNVGGVHTLRDSAGGVFGRGAWTQASLGRSQSSGDQFGAAIATGDFNGDDYTDLAVGIPGKDVGGASDAGAVEVMYGGPQDDAFALKYRRFTQDSTGIGDYAQAGDRFGAALATGDVDGDGRTDLVIGIPGEDDAGFSNTGAIAVLFGGGGGLSDRDAFLTEQDTSGADGSGHRYGHAVAVGDVNDDGIDDIAVGAPGWRRGAGVVEVLSPSASSITGKGVRRIAHDSEGFLGASNDGDAFGSALATGDVDADGYGDVAVGAPGDHGSRGAVSVLFGSANGIRTRDHYVWQDSADILGSAQAGDRFGAAIAIGRFNSGAPADLAVGIPGENTAGANNAGAVAVIYGNTAGVSTNDQLWSQASSGVDGSPEAGDLFGSALAIMDLNTNGWLDLAVGAPGEDSSTGALTVLLGAAGGVTGSDLYRIGNLGPGATGNRYGASLAS